MPQKAEFTNVSQGIGETEGAQVNILSELLQDLFDSGDLLIEDDKVVLGPDVDQIVIAIPDTGKGRFNPSHDSKPDKDGKTKRTKACFVIAELGGSFAGQGIDFRQSQGDVEGLPLTVKLSVIAQAPNPKGETIDEALNRKPQLEVVQKTGTDN